MPENNSLIDSALKYVEAYNGDDRDCINTDVMNAFYAGAQFFSSELERLSAELAEFRKMVFTSGDRNMTMDGRVFTANSGGFISDNNFDFDAGLQVSGDFVDDEKEMYAEMIVSVLNAPALTPN